MTYNPYSVQFLKSALQSNKLWLSSARGQNYLIDRNIAEKMISYIPSSESLAVVEAGSGLGSLTNILAEKFKTYSIEIDGGIYTLLKQYLTNKNLVLINGDFLKFDPGSIQEKQLFFISNTPYSIAGEIIRKFAEDEIFHEGLCMLQEEMVQRMSAAVSSPAYGPFTILCSHYLTVKKLFQVGRQSFYPVPSVDSTVVHISKKTSLIRQEDFNIFLRKGFLARRKTLLNNLKPLGFTPPGLEKMGINPALRPQDITPEQWETLYRIYTEPQRSGGMPAAKTLRAQK
ncbi:MAG: 16S rRNA (adenine(1518)-N(6)/adenine(1519)-N(6))-dimethyltransferase RsmA [Brevinematales bacterium]|jgi:16S rRNA (adenine1518-N6/adenine1519-N6)-dimethyltransferase